MFYSEVLLLKDELLYEQAQTENTFNAYEEYLDEFPRGSFAETAHQQAESLRLAGIKQKPELKQINAFLQNYPNSTHRKEVEKIIPRLWQEARFKLKEKMAEQNLGQSWSNAFMQIFEDLKETEEQKIYLKASYPRNLLLKWNNYPQRVRYDINEEYEHLKRSISLVNTFEKRDFVDLEEYEDIAKTISPIDFKSPNEQYPRSVSSHLSNRRMYEKVRPLADSVASQVQFYFPEAKIDVLPRNRSIPDNGVVLEIICQPANRTVLKHGFDYPELFIRLKKANSQHRYESGKLKKQLSKDEFRGYLFHIDILWEIRLLQKDQESVNIVDYLEKPGFSNPYIKDIRAEYMQMIDGSKENFERVFRYSLNQSLETSSKSK